MTISTNIISATESLVSWFLSGALKNTMEDYCWLNTANTETNLVSNDGSLATVVKVFGSKNVIGDEQISKLESNITSLMEGSFLTEGHKIQFVFTRDDDRTEQSLREMVDPYKDASKRVHLDFDDMFASKVHTLKKYCAYESVYMVLWTTTDSAKESIKSENEDIIEVSKETPITIDSQNVNLNYQSIKNNHNAFIDSIINGFNAENINVKVMHVKRALSDIKRLINSDYVHDNWEPVLAGDQPVLKASDRIDIRESDPSALLWPKIGSQIFPTDAEKVETDIYKFGDRYITPVTFVLAPQKILNFNQLITTINKEIPWQVSINLQSVRRSKLNLKSLATTMTAWTNSDNKLIKNGMDEIKDRLQNREAIVELSIDGITWADSVKELKKRRAIILKAFQGWGTATVEISKGDPVEAIISTMPALTKEPYGSITYAPLEEIVRMFPIIRQSHVWEKGSILMRTEDGKVFPFQPGSSKQTAWNNLVFATPGSGKSVLLNAINQANTSTLGSIKLPLMGILDIGPSSSEFIQMLQDSLPESQKHLVVAHKMKNSLEFAVNILDTKLGARMPTIEDMFFLSNTITMAITPVGREQYPATDKMVQSVLTKAYEYFSDKREPKNYSANFNKEIDIALSDLNISAEGKTWWEVTDLLFKSGQINMAQKAQRYAVPTIQDLVLVAQMTESIKDEYSKVKIETGENLLEYFYRSIGEVVQQYPMLAVPTVFDISSARMIALDLDEVCPRGDGSAKHQTGLMYMIGRYLVTKNFFIDKELLKKTPKIYHAYHQEHINELRETPKVICYDEFHRTTGLDGVRSQVLRDMREGRKWKMQVTLVSQLINDFDDEMVEIADGIFILSGGDNTKAISKKFNLNKTMSKILETKITGPTSKGAPMIYKFKAIDGMYSQFLYLTLSPVELWAFNTTAEDAALRSKISKVVGAKKARLILAKEFNSGSAKSYIESLTGDDIEDGLSSVDHVAKKILEKHNLLV